MYENQEGGFAATEAEDLPIGAIVPFSTVDWPGKLAAVCFLRGCPWRCPYCQNRIFWGPDAPRDQFSSLVALLEARRGLLDGVVFSGGEPTLAPSLPAAVRAVREMGFEVGLHTAGIFPERVAQIVPDLSWVGLDIKAPWDSYDNVTKAQGTGALARRTLEILLEAGVDLECRTTWHPSLVSQEDLVTIGTTLASYGVKHWAIQAYRSAGTDGSLPDIHVFRSDVPEAAQNAVPHFEFRGL